MASQLKTCVIAILLCSSLAFRSNLSPSIRMAKHMNNHRGSGMMANFWSDGMSRRDIMFAISSLSFVPWQAKADSQTSGISQFNLDERLRTVPFFAVAYSDSEGDSPVFSKRRKNGTPIAVFFQERADAEVQLAELRKKDPTVALITLPLDKVWALVTHPDETTFGGIFEMQANRRQIINANGITGQDLKLVEEAKIPLFFDRRLVVASTEEKDKVFPLFFKLADLEAVFKRSVVSSDLGEKTSMKPEVTTLDRAIASMISGEIDDVESIYFISSETF